MSDDLYAHWTAKDWRRLREQYRRDEERRTAEMQRHYAAIAAAALRRDKMIAQRGNS